MNEEFKNSLFWKIVKFGITLIASCFVILCAFAIMADENGIDVKYNKIIFILGAGLAVAISIISSYNKIQQIKEKIPKLIADVDKLKKKKNEIINSKSWKITKPLRFIRNFRF